MARRFMIVFAAVLVALVVAGISLPLWLGMALKGPGPSRGLTFAAYERVGYGRFALHDVEMKVGPTVVTMTRVESATPLLWLWQRLRDRSEPVVGERWSVEVTRRTEPVPVPNPARRRGWLPLHDTLRRIAGHLEDWLPEARIGAGVVRWPGGQVSLDAAGWSNRELTVERLEFRELVIHGRLTLPVEVDALRLAIRTVDEENSATFESLAGSVSGEIEWWEQPASITAAFAEQGWLPRQASLQAEALSIPGARLNLGEFYALVRGHVRMDWRDEGFEADVSLNGEPLENREGVPPLTVDLRGRGDTRSATIESLTVALPGVNAHLSEPFLIQRDDDTGAGAARFAVEADLSQVPWFEASGTIRGEAWVNPAGGGAPVVEMQLELRDLEAGALALASASASGRLEWPRLTLQTATMVGPAGERLEAAGGWDFRTGALVDASVAGQVRRQSIARWLPDQPEFEVISIRASASGAPADLRHEGWFEVQQILMPRLNPADVTVEWRGRGAAVERFEARAAFGPSNIVAAGSADGDSIALERLEFDQSGMRRLQLDEPATIRWRPTLQIGTVHLLGPDGSITGGMTWGESGRIELELNHISSTWLTDVMPPYGFEWQLSRLAATGTWDQGPMTFSLSGVGQTTLGGDHVITVSVAAQGDPDGLIIEALRASEGGGTVLNATGRFPVALHPLGDPFLAIKGDGALVAEATAAPHAVFWEQLATVTGVTLEEPQASVNLAGTWLRPQGSLMLKAESITTDPARMVRRLPRLDALELELSGDRNEVRLETFSVRAEGQLVRARGTLPIPDGWEDLLKEPLAAAREDADLRFEIPSAEVAAFAGFLPTFVAPTGTIEMDLTYQNGGFGGFLRLKDAASRPLGPLGVLQEINASLQMAGRRFELQEVSARSGGQKIALTGGIELPAGGPPRYDLALRGDNLPFVRQAGLLLRGDLDLRLETQAEGQPRLTGTVRLRDSLFLSDLRSLVPTGGSAGVRRPPYFAFEAPPLNTWALAVDVVGTRFLRLRTPVFSGVASARFRLGGTLGEPRAIGEAKLDEGAVTMPFANFDISQSAVRLTEANPFEPMLFGRGTARRFGYSLTMEIEGPAASPRVAFASSPALDSEQVLLMVMTGAPPTADINFSTTQRVTRIGTFLGQQLLSGLGADAANANRLSIAAGEKMSRQGRETYEIEYKLSDRLTLIGEYNEFDEQNAGLKWRIFPKAGERREAGDEAK